VSKVSKEYIKRVLKEIQDALDELKSITKFSESDFMSSRTLRFSARFSIIQIVEAASDLGIAILEKDFSETAESYREVFSKLALKGVIKSETAEEMEKIASLRNMIIHRYWRIDDRKIYRDAISGGICAIERFMEEVREYVSKDC